MRTFSIGGVSTTITNAISIAPGSQFIRNTVTIKNNDGSTALSNFRYWVANYDDKYGPETAISHEDSFMKTRGNLTASGFTQAINPGERCNALKILGGSSVPYEF